MTSITEILTGEQINLAMRVANHIMEHASPADRAAIINYGKYVAAKTPIPLHIEDEFLYATRSFPEFADETLNEFTPDQLNTFQRQVAKSVFNSRGLSLS